MVPSPADIARYRHIAAAVVRGVGLLVFLYAATRVGLFLWTSGDDLLAALGLGAGAGRRQRWNVERLVTGVALQAVLLAFSVFAMGWPGVLARWLVPAKVRAACPGCGFDVHGLRSEVCPECGLRLGPAFLPSDSKAGGGESE